MTGDARLARRRATEAQRPASDPNASVWVAASAGTGKTKVLTDRVLSLMLHDTAPARILCLTFTKAAAAEMGNRLAGRLARWATMADDDLRIELVELLGRAPPPPLLDQARRLFARVLDAPGGMNIQTIHAFCQSLLRRFPLEAGVAPHFQVLDERSSVELLGQAREEVLAAARQAPPEAAAGDPAPDSLTAAVAEVSIHVQQQAFTQLLAELIKERGRLNRLIRSHGGFEGAARAVFRVLGVDPGETPEAVVERACADEAFDFMGLRLAVMAMAGGTKTDRAHGEGIETWLAEPADRPAGFQSYLSAFFTDKGEGAPYRTLVHKAALAAAPGIDAVLAGEAERLDAVRAKLRAITVARATKALLRLGVAIQDAYAEHKRLRARLDYDDLILGARDLLKGQGAASWVLFKLDGGLDHILIDEAQDTNPDQWEVVALLAAEFFVGKGARDRPRTVFAVGDAKQSIFSFLRADPGAFARMRAHFATCARDAGQAWTKVDLAHSFRSTAAVLEAVDAVFARSAASDGVRFDEARLSHASVRLGQAGVVELWPPSEPEPQDPVEPWEPPPRGHGQAPARTRLAKLIANTIWRWTSAPAEEPNDLRDSEAWLTSKNRRLVPGDVLVLVRRRNLFVEELVRELKRLEVPVAGVDRMVLRDQLAVMDLVALGRFLLLPEDDLNLATVLKGPFVGLDEEQLFALAYGRDGSLWQALRDQAERDPALESARENLALLLARADFLPPYELYARILNRDWGAGRGRERLLARLGPDANDPIEEFLSLALAYQRDYAPALEGFLHWLDAGAQEVKRDMEHGHDAVRVMTVHGAKGLQAPVVFLPDTLQTPKAKDGLFWLEEEGGIALWPLRKGYDGAAARAARARAQAIQDQEYRRLLYVAMTRAEDRLYVCGWNMKTAAPAKSWYELVKGALAEVGDPVHFDFTEGTREGGWAGAGWRLSCPQTAAPEEIDIAIPRPAATRRPIPPWARENPGPEPTPPRPLAPSRSDGPEPAVRSPLGPDEGTGYHRGRLIHRLIQSLPDLPPARRPAAARRFLRRPLHGLSRDARAEIENTTLAVLEDPALAPLFGPGSRAEVPIIGVIRSDGAASVISGQVDRLVVTREAVLIVDYKTHRPAPETEAQVPTLYLRQMAAYRAVLAGIYGGRRIDCALLWTDGPRLMHLNAALLDSHAP